MEDQPPQYIGNLWSKRATTFWHNKSIIKSESQCQISMEDWLTQNCPLELIFENPVGLNFKTNRKPCLLRIQAISHDFSI